MERLGAQGDGASRHRNAGGPTRADWWHYGPAWHRHATTDGYAPANGHGDAHGNGNAPRLSGGAGASEHQHPGSRAACDAAGHDGDETCFAGPGPADSGPVVLHGGAAQTMRRANGGDQQDERRGRPIQQGHGNLHKVREKVQYAHQRGSEAARRPCRSQPYRRQVAQPDRPSRHRQRLSASEAGL